MLPVLATVGQFLHFWFPRCEETVTAFESKRNFKKEDYDAKFETTVVPLNLPHAACQPGYVSHANAFQIESGKKTKVKGSIVSRKGDQLNVVI